MSPRLKPRYVPEAVRKLLAAIEGYGCCPDCGTRLSELSPGEFVCHNCYPERVDDYLRQAPPTLCSKK